MVNSIHRKKKNQLFTHEIKPVRYLTKLFYT